MIPLSVLVCLLFCFHKSESIYFHMKETEERCFIEDLAEDTLVIDKQFKPTKDIGIKMRVTDPSDELVLDRFYSEEGRLVFNSHKPGEYRLCLSTDSNTWFGGSQLRVYLDILVGDHAVDYHEVATKDKLDDLQIRVRQLLDQVHAISKDQNYQRVREAHFREYSESTNKRVTYWSLFQLLLLLGIGFWQIRHLRSFFQSKKLV